jgi:cyclophilin family peptidyl-prolyl cis-trans isomerase/protein-disulfide isomerase
MRKFVLAGLLLLVGCSTAAVPTATGVPTQNVVFVTSAPSTPTPAKPVGGAADHALGIDSAYLTIVLYGDFQCAPCVDVARTLAIMHDRNPDNIRIVWRHFPQPENNKAHLAAEASEAAAVQGKFWELHDQLFTHQAEWSSLSVDQFRAKLNDYAKFIGVADLAAFNTTLDQKKYAALVDKATQEASDLGFKSAPVLLFNGLPYSGRIDEFALNGYAQLRLLGKRQYKTQPVLQIDLKKHYTATLTTEKGNIVIELYTQAAPVTVNNFVFLARNGWYNNITFHRVIPNQLAQTGDPSGSGFGTAGYTIVDEADNGLHFDREGVVAMASDPNSRDSGSSQFFITYGPLTPAVEYDRVYTIFGQVKSGMDVLRKLTPRDPFDQLRYPNPPPGDKLVTIQISETN